LDTAWTFWILWSSLVVLVLGVAAYCMGRKRLDGIVKSRTLQSILRVGIGLFQILGAMLLGAIKLRPWRATRNSAGAATKTAERTRN
jgi:hypothetical protein